MDIQEAYKHKQMTPEEIAAALPPDAAIMSDMAPAAPRSIILALTERIRQRGDFHGVYNSTLNPYPCDLYSRPELLRDTRMVSWFSGVQERAAVNEGRGDRMGYYYRDAAEGIRKYLNLDVFVAAVSPMDRHGYFSFGAVASTSEALLEKAKYIYLEVNPQMPRSVHGPQIHISQVTGFCESDYPLAVIPRSEPDEISKKIGGYIAQEIPNGATIQLGIGAVPDAVSNALKDKHDLGIHTEMLTDGMIELIECGAVTNDRKPIHRGRTVATFAFGSQRIYDYIDDNPAVMILPADYVNNPAVIAGHPNFISVNAAVEVDLFGQVSAESHGIRHISGTGGQVDFVQGAIHSEGGKSFIAFPSTTKNGAASRICVTLTPGSIVTTGKNDTDYVVTEYGIARVRGCTLSQRAKNLISIAHPKFREELTMQAKKCNIII